MQHKARGVPFGHSKQATSNAVLRPNYPPSLRVASKCGACGVALLAKGTTLGFVPQGDFLRGVARLAVIRIWRQRVSCGECQQTLEVELRDGSVLAYSSVSQEVYRQFMNAPSPTSYYEDKIADEFSARRL